MNGPYRPDSPARLLAYCVRWMPGERHDWGLAMQSELAQIRQRGERWRFAFGCIAAVVSLNATLDTLTDHPRLAALAGFVQILPFAVLNAIVANRVEPFFSLIRPGIHTSPFEYSLLLVVLLLLPFGAFLSLRPLLRRGAHWTMGAYLLNGGTAALLLVGFVVLSTALGSDIYACDVLKIPNCD